MEGGGSKKETSEYTNEYKWSESILLQLLKIIPSMNQTTPLKESKQNILETKYVKIWIEEGILYCIYANDLDVDIETVKSVVTSRIDFSKGVSYPVLIDVKGIRSFTKEARDYAGKEGAKLIKASAIIVDSALTKTLLNLFLLINNPNVPIKLFTDEKEAKEWLQHFKSGT
ncbi:MAG: hypothetical protein V4511_03730 [Bacteroidota bacterium]